MTNANGKFEVQLNALEPFTSADEVRLGRMSIEKTFTGDLSGSSRGEMLSVRTDSGAAGYVAIEHVSGALNGKSGGFTLQHSGTMSADGSNLIIEVVPGSGSGQLDGISGTMEIDNADGVHTYVFTYQI